MPTLATAVVLSGSITSPGGTVASGSFTPAAGAVLVVKASSGVPEIMPTSVSGGGLTWTSRFSFSPASQSPIVLFTAVVGAGPSAMTVTVTYTATTGPLQSGAVLEQWTSAALASTPALSTGTTDTTAPYQATITPTTVGSVISAMAADFTASSTTSPTLLSGATLTNRFASSGTVVLNCFSQPVAVAGTSQTFGMSAPTGQSVDLGAIEILDSSSVPGQRGFAFMPYLGLGGGVPR
jgi:hypothetical protein